jgi:hypothetical protein
MVRVEASLTFEDYWRFNRSVLLNRFGLMLALAGFGPLVGFLAILILDPSRLTIRYFTLPFFSILVLFFVPYSTWHACRNRWKASSELSQKRVYEFDERGVRWEASYGRAELAWDVIDSVTTDSTLLLIWTQARAAAFILPIGQLSPEQLREILDLSDKRIGR